MLRLLHNTLFEGYLEALITLVALITQFFEFETCACFLDDELSGLLERGVIYFLRSNHSNGYRLYKSRLSGYIKDEEIRMTYKNTYTMTWHSTTNYELILHVTTEQSLSGRLIILITAFDSNRMVYYRDMLQACSQSHIELPRPIFVDAPCSDVLLKRYYNSAEACSVHII